MLQNYTVKLFYYQQTRHNDNHSYN